MIAGVQKFMHGTKPGGHYVDLRNYRCHCVAGWGIMVVAAKPRRPRN